jgi:hypothetical protein
MTLKCNYENEEAGIIKTVLKKFLLIEIRSIYAQTGAEIYLS